MSNNKGHELNKSPLKRFLRKSFALGFVAYCGTSYFLFKFPHFRGRPETQRRDIKGSNKVVISAHRCGSYDNLENSVPAAVHAITKAGANIIQFDVRATKDNVPILIHDGDLSRPTHQGKFSEQFNFKDLPKVVTESIDVPFMADLQGNQHFYKLKKTDTKQLNSLEDLLKALDKADPSRKIWLHLEFKGGNEALIQESLRLLKHYHRDHRVLWGHPDDKLSQTLHQVAPQINRTASPGEIHRLYFLYLAGLLPFTNLTYQSIWFPMLTQGFHRILLQQYGSSKYKNNEDGNNWKYRLRVKTLEFMIRTSGPLFEHLQKRGIFVMVGVPNTEEDYRECLKFNGDKIDGIITDRPALLKEYLAKEGPK